LGLWVGFEGEDFRRYNGFGLIAGNPPKKERIEAVV